MWHIAFRNAGALWLATAAALPLVIHLLSRKRPQVIRFPAVRFVRRSKRRSFRRTRLRHLLLLLLRMALLALFAVLIARPVLTRGESALAEAAVEGTPAAVLVLDDSLSMNFRSGDATWFDAARNRAMELAHRLPSGVAASVVTTSQPGGKLARSPDALRGRISGLRPTMRGSSCWRALDSAAQMLRQQGASRRDIYLFTDMTPSAWAGLEGRALDLGSDVNLWVIDCADAPGANAAVYELRQAGEAAMIGAMLAVEARFIASGRTAERAVQFELDGAVLARRDVSLSPGEESAATFRVLLTEPGHHWGRVAFLNPDGLPQDDARTFTLEVAPEVSVLCVEDDPQAELESASYFLRLALNPWGGGDERGIFRIRRAGPDELTELPLGPFDVVALVDAAGVDDSAWRRLEAYVSGGGGVLVFAGAGAEESHRTAAASAVLPARVGPAVAAPPESQFGLRIVMPSHPFVTALGESGAALSQVRYRQCRRITLQPDADELLSFGPGLPALAVSARGGRVALFAATADERWGDFAKTEPFVPFCHELVLYLAGRTAAGIRSVPVGARVSLPLEESPWPTVAYVTAPGARQPERVLPGATRGRQVFRSADVPGYYRLDLEHRDRKWRSGFAVNTVPIESRLEKVPFGQVQAAIQARQVRLVTDAALSDDGMGAAGPARELTPYAALLALALLVAECFLANRFYGTASG